MEEYFTGGDDFYGGAVTPFTAVAVQEGAYFVRAWMAALVIALLLLLWLLHSQGVFKKKSGFEGLAPGPYSLRDDVGWDSKDPYAMAQLALQTASTAGVKQNLVEAGREPDLYNVDPVELATQLAIRKATTTKDQETTETAKIAAAMAANAAAAPAKFTERMTPEEELKRQQAAAAGLTSAGL